MKEQQTHPVLIVLGSHISTNEGNKEMFPFTGVCILCDNPCVYGKGSGLRSETLPHKVVAFECSMSFLEQIKSGVQMVMTTQQTGTIEKKEAN